MKVNKRIALPIVAAVALVSVSTASALTFLEKDTPPVSTITNEEPIEVINTPVEPVGEKVVEEEVPVAPIIEAPVVEAPIEEPQEKIWGGGCTESQVREVFNVGFSEEEWQRLVNEKQSRWNEPAYPGTLYRHKDGREFCYFN